MRAIVNYKTRGRTNANGVYGQSAGNDKITSENTAIGEGTYNITVFDQGMRNGYNNAAGADTKGHLDQDVVLIENAIRCLKLPSKRLNSIWKISGHSAADRSKYANRLRQYRTEK